MSQSSAKQQATALKYSIEREGSAPIVVASGMGTVAQKIVDVAMENDVPIYEDDSLAALLAQLQVGATVPPSLFQAIVDIYIYFLNYKLPEGNSNDDSADPEPVKAQTANVQRQTNENDGFVNFESFD